MAAPKLLLVTLQSLGKGFKQIANPLTGLVDLFLSTDAKNGLSFGSDGGLFASIPAAASSTNTSNGTVPPPGAAGDYSYLAVVGGQLTWLDSSNVPISNWPALGTFDP